MQATDAVSWIQRYQRPSDLAAKAEGFAVGPYVLLIVEETSKIDCIYWNKEHKWLILGGIVQLD